MRKAARPLFAIALTATVFSALCITLVLYEPGTLTLRWTDKDFANYWVASRLALEGRALTVFGPHPSYLQHMRTLFGAAYPWHAWSYPPHYLLLMLPVGLLPYKAALLSFVTATFLLLCGAVRLACPQPRWWQLLLLLPAVVTNAYAAQNGFLISALILAGLALRDRRPVLAGICFGILTIKPQLGVLLPILLLWERQWMVIASACLSTLALIGASIAVFGTQAWSDYVVHITPYQTYVMTEMKGLFLHMMPTVFGSVRNLAGDAATAFAIHIPFALAVLALYGFTLVRLARPQARAASTLFATTLAVPYLLNYDLVALVAAAVLWTGRDRVSPAWRCGLAGLALIPMIMPLLGILDLPVAPLIILLAWLGLLDQEGALRRIRPRSNPAIP